MQGQRPVTTEAEAGRPLSGNVSPDLINALKSTPTHCSAMKSSGSNGQTVAKIGEANRLKDECQAKAGQTNIFSNSINTCAQVGMAPGDLVGTYLYQCQATHKAAFQQYAKTTSS